MHHIDLNCLNLASAVRPKKKISSKDLKDLPIYIFGYNPEKLFEPRINLNEYSVLLGACTYYGMSNLYPINNEVLDEGIDEKNKDRHNRYIKIPGYDKTSYMEKTIRGFYVPTEARCIIDCIRYFDLGVYEEQLLIAIEDYLDLDRSIDELYEVADFYNVPRQLVDSWIIKSDKYSRYEY